jgi:hypothetical protein
MFKALALIVVPALLLLPSREAHAASEAVCHAYTAAAVAAAKEVRDRGCSKSNDNPNGFDLLHGQWSTDPIAHSDWCLQASDEQVDHETVERESQLKKCRTCDGYSAEAVDGAREVREKMCGYDLRRAQWSEGRLGHLKWCMGANNESIDNATIERRGALNQCRRCDQYTRNALSQTKFVREKACGYNLTDPMWSEDRTVHFGWCMRSLSDTAYWEDAARNKAEVSCKVCRDYADAAMLAIDEAKKLKCVGTGPRWSEKASDHFDWCMNIDRYDDSFFGGGPRTWDEIQRKSLDPETGARAGEIARCKATASAQQGLKKGAGGAAPYIVVPRQKDKAATKPVTAARKPPGSSAVDQVKPVGSARKQYGTAGVDTVKPSDNKPCKPGQRNDPCKPKAKVLGPGLLEGGGGFSTQGGPAGAGTAAAGGGGAGGGGGVGVSTFRSPSNMVAPPAGGGLR